VTNILKTIPTEEEWDRTERWDRLEMSSTLDIVLEIILF
jgi:hypothetical protein